MGFVGAGIEYERDARATRSQQVSHSKTDWASPKTDFKFSTVRFLMFSVGVLILSLSFAALYTFSYSGYRMLAIFSRRLMSQGS